MSAPEHAPTRIRLRDMRANAVYGLLVSPRGASVRVVTDIYELADLGGWRRIELDVAIADLVGDGRLSDNEVGRLVVKR